MSPSVYIIGGPNGAGKTTFARRFLPGYANCENFVNADLIAQGLSPFSPDAAAFSAGRMMLEQIESFGRRHVDFGFETTLSGTTYSHILRRLRERGYMIWIFFVWLPEAELSLSRIRERVSQGGHNIPEPVARRRYDRSIRNFFRIYRHLSDSWYFFDNSGEIPELIACNENGEPGIIDAKMFDRLARRYAE